MRRSFVKLVALSVLGCWLVGFVLLATYSLNMPWTEERARSEGIFLVHEMLAATDAASRARRLDELRPHFARPFDLVSEKTVREALGRDIGPNAHVPHPVSRMEQWHYFSFRSGEEVLAVGPFNPARPAGYIPIGVILGVVFLPVLGGMIALRVERSLRRVERASRALATGDFSARVDSEDGTPDELATSFNAMAARIQELVRGRDELVQAISHELGTPLARVRFHLELLDQTDRASHAERKHAIVRELDALDALVSELLSFVQSDDMSLDKMPFDASRTARDLAEIERLEHGDGHGLSLEVRASEEAEVHADPRLWQRVIENILRNAMRHARSQVLVEVADDEAGLVVSIHDDGPGIPATMREKVLTPFFRLDEERDRRTGGVGLGLAIARRILERHEGTLTITDSPLGGAAIETSWPRT